MEHGDTFGASIGIYCECTKIVGGVPWSLTRLTRYIWGAPQWKTWQGVCGAQCPAWKKLFFWGIKLWSFLSGQIFKSFSLFSPIILSFGPSIFVLQSSKVDCFWNLRNFVFSLSQFAQSVFTVYDQNLKIFHFKNQNNDQIDISNSL